MKDENQNQNEKDDEKNNDKNENKNQMKQNMKQIINQNPTEKTLTFLQEHEVLQILGTSCFPTNKLQFFVHLLDDVICRFSNSVSFGFRFFIFSKARHDLGSTGIQGLIRWSVATARWWMLRRDKI